MGTIDFSSIPNLLSSQAEGSPEALALLAPDRTPLTYGWLNEQVVYIKSRLNAMGIGRTDRLAVVLPNGPDMAVAFLGIACTATSAPLNPSYSESEFDFYLSELNARALVVLAGFDSPAITVARARDIPIIEIAPSIIEPEAHFGIEGEIGKLKKSEPPTQPDDVALVLHTSGTTSRPKIVPLTHRNLCGSAQSIQRSLQLTPGDCCLNVMPLFHIHGLVAALLASLSAGASVVCTPGFMAPQFFDWLDAFHPSWYTAVPTMHQAILARASAYQEVISRARLRFVRSCSASLPPQLMDQMERVFGVPVIEAYGMTEASHQMTSNPLPPGARKPASVGISTGTEVAIMAEDCNHLMPAMQSGEIVVRGPNVMQGYADNPDSNIKVFTKGWFRTGDHGHLDSEGYLFITGRLKEIINRGGEKISPGEVEAVLLDHPGVIQAVAFALPDAVLGEDVAAAVILNQPSVTEIELRRFVSLYLSPFKVPRRILILDEIPKGPTGKIQRIGLAEKLGLASEHDLPTPISGKFVSPSTEIEKMLSEIWCDVLGLTRVSVQHRFLELGGDSILATLLVTRICQTFAINLTLLDFFDAPTIAEQSIAIEGLLLDEIEALSENEAGRRNTRESWQNRPIEHADLALRRSWLSPADLVLLEQRLKGNRDRDAPTRTIPCLSDRTEAPVSFSQQRLWFTDQWNPEIATFNRPIAFHLKGDLNIVSLERSLNEILQRHEILRTTFPVSDGQPVQKIGEFAGISLFTEDLTYISQVDRQVMAEQRMIEMLQVPFVMESGPLFRVSLYRLDAEDHIFFLVTHHILFDGWSEVLFVNELCALYKSFESNDPVSLPDLPIQYSDFAAWQKEMVHDEKLKAQSAYWQKELAEPLPILDLPDDRHRPRLQTYRGSTVSLVLSSPLVAGLEAICCQEGVTLFMTLLAGFKVLLYRHTGQTDIIVGAPVAGRRHPETEKLIGVFVNTLALRTDLGGDPTFRELLRRIRQTCLGAYTHQDLPFEKLVVEINPVRDLGRTPIFQVVFNMENLPERSRTAGQLEVTPMDLHPSVALFDLSVELTRKVGEIHCEFVYNSDLFEAITIQHLVRHFQILLEGIIAGTKQRLSDLPLLTTEEQHQLLVKWNETQAEYPRDVTVPQLFEAQVALTPESVAVVYEDKALTYRELNQKANQLAHVLRRLGVGPEILVGLCVERSLDMMVGLLGILKAGGAYVPLDPTYPWERLAFMIEDTRIPVLLTQTGLAARLAGCVTTVISLDVERQAPDLESFENLDSRSGADNLAYVIYTSGSTGKPKGVCISNSALTNILTAMLRRTRLASTDILPALSAISFDVATPELFLPLLVGATVFIISSEHAADSERLRKTLDGSSQTFMFATPSTWSMLLQAGWSGSKSMKAHSTGEKLPRELAHELLPRVSELWNLYGPTETAVWSVAGKVLLADDPVQIGRPMENTQVYVLDSKMRSVPLGVPGELYIGGDGLARGYLNRPDLTAERFVPNPFNRKPGTRLYRTGDLARYLPNGNLELLGRTDHQIKMRGFRIEPAEIEMVLEQHPHVKRAIVIAREDLPTGSGLVAYVIPKVMPYLTVSELRSYMKAMLPDYMLPTSFVFLEAFPLTPNGKLDRAALPAPDQHRPLLEEAFAAPQTPVEVKLTEIWTGVLGLEQVGIHDDFFDLGGHSLLATQIISRVRDALQVELPLRSLFERPTIAGLAERIEVFRILGRASQDHLEDGRACHVVGQT